MTSAKTQFLRKLEAHRAKSRPFYNQVQADIAALDQSITQLQARMQGWLEGSGIESELTAETLTDLLAGQQAFPLPGLRLRYGGRAIALSPLFLYGHGVMGCLEISLRAEGRRTPLGRLFMRAGTRSGWIWVRTDRLHAVEESLSEEAFFNMLSPLLPE